MKTFRKLHLLLILIFAISLSSCVVTKKKYEALERSKRAVVKKANNLSKENKEKDEEIEGLTAKVDSVNFAYANILTEYNDMKSNYAENNAKKTSEIDSLSYKVMSLASDTSALSRELQEAIDDYTFEKNNLTKLRAVLEQKEQRMNELTIELEEKQKRLAELETMIETNKAQVAALKNKVAEALVSFDETDLTIVQKDGKVYVSLDEKLLFKTGSTTVDRNGVKALTELAKVLENTKDIDIMVEGHTDNVGDPKFNWDLSVKRATSIVKILQDNSNVDPKRFIASGRGMYLPVNPADTDEARASNRRTEIILTPKLSALYEILDEDIEK